MEATVTDRWAQRVSCMQPCCSVHPTHREHTMGLGAQFRAPMFSLGACGIKEEKSNRRKLLDLLCKWSEVFKVQNLEAEKKRIFLLKTVEYIHIDVSIYTHM